MDAPFPELEPVFEAIRNGRLDQALETARQLAETADGQLAIEARRHVGLCFFHLGDYASAIPNFLEVAKADGDRQSWFVLSLARTMGGDPEGGARDFQKAVDADEPPRTDAGRQLTEHFMRFDYMHVLVDAWQWQRAKTQLDTLAAAMGGLARHDNDFLFERGFPLLGDLLDGALRVLEIVPDSNPLQWLLDFRKQLTGQSRTKVDQAIQALARKLGPPM